MSRRRLGAGLAATGGLCLLAAGSTGGAGLYRWLLLSVAHETPGEIGRLLVVAAIVLSVLAGFGGLTVLAGAWVIRRHSAPFGAFLVQVGAGFGLLGLVLHAARALAADEGIGLVVGSLTTLGGLGVLLAVAGAAYANPLRIAHWWRRLRRARR